MNFRLMSAACALLVPLCGCGGGKASTPGRAALPPDWRNVATNADRERLRGWRDSWTAALAKVRAAGKGPALTLGGALFDPDRALSGAMPPPGDYRCRMFKLGAKAEGNADYSAQSAMGCRIAQEGDVFSIAKIDGAQRPVGLLFKDTDTRSVFLGTLVLGDETSPMQYGQDATRDMVGYVERIGDRRWRVVLPAPAFESLLDVVELVPAG